MTFVRHTPPIISDAQIVAFADGVETPHSATLLKESILANQYGKYSLPTGLWVGETNGERHLLKRANVTEPFVTDTGKLDLWQLFRPGDKLHYVEPHIKLTVTTLTVGTTVTIEIGDYSDVFTFAGTEGSTVEDAAAELVQFLNVQSPSLSAKVKALQDGADVHVFAADGYTAHVVALTTAGTVALDPAGGTMATSLEVGTIQNISNLPESAGEVTLTGAATNPAPLGAKVGVPAGRVLGFINKSLDMTYSDRCHVALISAASGIREGRLPYVDGDIKRQLPKLNIQRRF